MAQETPAWLTPSFVEKILRKSEGDNSIQVIDLSVKSATAKGDNYQSEMVRVVAKYSRGQGGEVAEKSIIFKIAPSLDSLQGELIAEGNAFDIEISVISDTLAKMNKMVEPKYRLGPKSLYMQSENPALIVMEDLAVLGYRMADRLSGLDLDHCLLSMSGLARFHATSVALCEREPEQKEKYMKGVYCHEQPPSVANFFIACTKGFVDEIANWPELKGYAEKIAKITDRIYDIAIEAAKPSEDQFNVINHGDYWVNNMLFKYDNDKPVDHIFVDFQQCSYTTPAMDILYFLETSPSPEVIENQRDLLLNEYHSTLTVTMKQLNCKTQPPTRDELEDILKQKAVLGMIASFTILPLVLCSKSNVQDFNDFMADGVCKNPGLKGESFKKLMITRVPLYEQWGLLDL